MGLSLYSISGNWQWQPWYRRDNADDHREAKGYTYIERVGTVINESKSAYGPAEEKDENG